ncbi:MAG: hypothetical protein HY290_00260 [Planctomycetia bacterium]|nr:hypothetical protein [Planctomycetia bacterium]
MHLRHLDADCQIEPQELALKPAGPNRFEIVLSGKTLAELRAVLQGDESASRRSRDE